MYQGWLESRSRSILVVCRNVRGCNDHRPGGPAWNSHGSNDVWSLFSLLSSQTWTTYRIRHIVQRVRLLWSKRNCLAAPRDTNHSNRYRGIHIFVRWYVRHDARSIGSRRRRGPFRGNRSSPDVHAFLRRDHLSRDSDFNRVHFRVSTDRRSGPAGIRRREVELARRVWKLLALTRHVLTRRAPGHRRYMPLLRRHTSRISYNTCCCGRCVRTSVWFKFRRGSSEFTASSSNLLTLNEGRPNHSRATCCL